MIMRNTVFTVDNTVYQIRENPSYGNWRNESGYNKTTFSVDQKTLNTKQDKKDIVKSLAGKKTRVHIDDPLVFAIDLFIVITMFAIFTVALGWIGIIPAIVISGVAILAANITIAYPYPVVAFTNNENYSSKLHKELKHGMKKISDTPLFISNSKLNTLESQGNRFHATVSIPDEHFTGFTDVISSCSEEERARFARIFNLLADEELIDSEREKLYEALQNYVDAHTSYVAANKALTPRKHAEEIETIYSDSIIQKDVQNENYKIINQ